MAIQERRCSCQLEERTTARIARSVMRSRPPDVSAKSNCSWISGASSVRSRSCVTRTRHPREMSEFGVASDDTPVEQIAHRVRKREHLSDPPRAGTWGS